MNKVLSFFEANSIAYQLIEHEPLFTVDQASVALADAPGTATKNLFLRDDKGKRHFLVTVKDSKKVDLRRLEKALNSKGLGFASAERLRKFLGVEPGSVTLLAVINDPDSQVEVYVDREVWDTDHIQCHPLVNTATVITPKEELVRYIDLCGHSVTVLDIPGE